MEFTQRSGLLAFRFWLGLFIRVNSWLNSCCFSCLCHQGLVAVRTAVAEKLPDVAYLGNHVKIKVGNHQLIFVAAALSDDLAPRVAEVALAVKFADVPWRFSAHAVQRADKISIGHGMRRLFQLPKIF